MNASSPFRLTLRRTVVASFDNFVGVVDIDVVNVNVYVDDFNDDDGDKSVSKSDDHNLEGIQRGSR